MEIDFISKKNSKKLALYYKKCYLCKRYLCEMIISTEEKESRNRGKYIKQTQSNN